MDDDLFELPLDEIRERGIPQMPHTLRGALEALVRDNEFYNQYLLKRWLILINIINWNSSMALWSKTYTIWIKNNLFLLIIFY